jgi:hypothetical protein
MMAFQCYAGINIERIAYINASWSSLKCAMSILNGYHWQNKIARS